MQDNKQIKRSAVKGRSLFWLEVNEQWETASGNIETKNCWRLGIKRRSRVRNRIWRPERSSARVAAESFTRRSNQKSIAIIISAEIAAIARNYHSGRVKHGKTAFVRSAARYLRLQDRTASTAQTLADRKHTVSVTDNQVVTQEHLLIRNGTESNCDLWEIIGRFYYAKSSGEKHPMKSRSKGSFWRFEIKGRISPLDNYRSVVKIWPLI